MPWPLAHFRSVDHDDDGAVAGDADPGIESDPFGFARRHGCVAEERSPRRAATACSPVNRPADTLIGSAATQDAGHRVVDVAVGRIGRRRKQCACRHHHTRLAVAALRHALRDPRANDRILRIAGQAFDRGDVPAGRIADRIDASAHRHPVGMYGTGTAFADPAAIFGTLEAEVVAKHPEKRGLAIAHDGCGFAVDDERDHARPAF